MPEEVFLILNYDRSCEGVRGIHREASFIKDEPYVPSITHRRKSNKGTHMMNIKSKTASNKHDLYYII